MKVIVINGHAESGKSTFVKMCAEYPNADVYEFSMIDAAKAMARVIDWDESQKNPRDRKFLSDLKDLIDLYSDASYEYVKYQIENHVLPHDINGERVIFVHAREPQDITRLVNDFNARTLVIRRKSVETIRLDNHADSNWWVYSYDYAVDNNDGLEFLKSNSENFMKYILSEDWGYEMEEEN